MFTVEEITLMSFYNGYVPCRKCLVDSLKSILPHFEEHEFEAKELTERVIFKLESIDDVVFSEINWSESLDDIDDSVVF